MSLGPFVPTVEQEGVIGHAGSAFITACPGAGKTRVLVERARVLLRIRENGRGVAFLSFTNAAVSELEGRLRAEALLSSPPFPHFIGTFDSFLWQFLIAPFGIPGCSAAPRLIPDKDSRKIRLSDKLRELPLECFDRETGDAIPEVAQRLGFDPAANPSLTKAYRTAARNARTRSIERGELDFTDARLIAAARLNDPVVAPRLAAALAARFREVIVDEAQDCNPADLEIIGWLRKAGIVTKVICDPHQSIYEFRGGVTEQLLAFGLTFGDDDRLPMNGNFRSTDHICKTIVALRAADSRNVIDQALGEFRSETTPIYIIAYPGTSVPATIGTRFQGLVNLLNLDVANCPVLAATRRSSANAIGQPVDPDTTELTLRLAMAVTDFHFAAEIGNRKAALEEIHKVVLDIDGGIGNRTYHQHLVAEGIEASAWRPQILQLARELRYDPAVYPNANAWHTRAMELLASYVPAGGPSIRQRLRRVAALDSALAVPLRSSPSARTIHSVKGMEFPGVCVVMSVRTAKGILDYLETGQPTTFAEESRKIYVAASRAQRLLAIAVPKSRATRLSSHIQGTGASISMIQL
jgi:superfamily I DNA/RNA helicase